MKTELINQLLKISDELIECNELIESGKMHLATASAMKVQYDVNQLVRMMWRAE